MKFLISLLLMTFALQANATLYDSPVNMTRGSDGCQYQWPFREQGSPSTQISFSGTCVGKKAHGYAVIYEKDRDASYFLKFIAGKADIFAVVITNGVPNPTVLSSTVDGVVLRYDRCNDPSIRSACDQLMQKYREMKPTLPKNPFPKNSGSSSGSGSGSSSSGGGRLGGLGPVTPPPAEFLRSVRGERVACTEEALGAIGNKLMAKYYNELHSNSMCTAARAGAKAHYEAIITIEQSCPPAMIPQVADMQPLRNELQSALDIAAYSCP